jgi:hypothetical protein
MSTAVFSFATLSRALNEAETPQQRAERHAQMLLEARAAERRAAELRAAVAAEQGPPPPPPSAGPSAPSAT